MPLTAKEITILRTARANARLAWEVKNKYEYDQTFVTINDLGIPILYLTVSDEVFERTIKEDNEK